MTRIEQLEQRLKRLEQKICCNKTQFYDTLPEFPPVGVENTLYVDNSTGAIYIWDTDTQTYITTDTAPVEIPESKIDLNTELPLLTPLDTNNPTTAEVQAWATANLTGTDLTNGTQLIYNAPSGGDAANPDYTWTVNNGVVTLSNKRVFNTKTVYVDAGSGSDVTGKRGYREFPFKTFDAAINNIQTNEVVSILPNTYTSNTVVNVLNRDINIHLENGVTLSNVAGHFIGNYTWPTGPYNVGEVGNINITGYGNLIHQPTSLTRLFLIPYDYSLNVRLKKLELKAGSNQAWGAMAYSKISNIEIDDIIADNNKVVYASAVYNTVPSNSAPFSRVFKVKNILVSNQTSRAHIIRDQSGSFVDNSQLSIDIDNIYFDSTCSTGVTYLLQRDALVDALNYRSNVKIKNILNLRSGTLNIADYTRNMSQADIHIGGGNLNSFSFRKSYFNFDIDNIITNGLILCIDPIIFTDSKVSLNIKNGISNNSECFNIFQGPTLNNSSFELNGNLETLSTNSPCGIIKPTSGVLKITGNYKTSAIGKATIQVVQGTTDNTIYLENCTLINDGTVPAITTNSAIPISIVCKNVKSNSLLIDPNIVEVGEAITRNSNYK